MVPNSLTWAHEWRKQSVARSMLVEDVAFSRHGHVLVVGDDSITWEHSRLTTALHRTWERQWELSSTWERQMLDVLSENMRIAN